MKAKRKYRAVKLLNKLKHHLQPKMLWFFFEAKDFSQDQTMNLQNSWLGLTSQNVLIEMKAKHPVHIVVFGMVPRNGDFMILLIFSLSLRLNTDAYIKCLMEVVLLWIEKVLAGRTYI